ncbi:interleukin 17a/f2 [Salarias fasciatus]|uniref:Interleukin-17A-like n=1 Tax=Salarias fasciatus TaxID=181472 RepID=A0A672F2T5_SALFA|nr:interleukin-17A-like [Salarias fasciatus]
MKRSDAVVLLLVCCSALWVASSAEAEAPPPGCNFQMAMSSTSDGNTQRSLSPWSWRSSTVRDRIPATLWEAQCSSRSCPGPGPDQTQTPGRDVRSVPIYQSVLVLTRRHGARCYSASYCSVAVGCTCTRAQTRQT